MASQQRGNGRVVLDGVPPVGFYPSMQQRDDSRMRCPEDVPLPSCLRACLEYLGDGLGCRKIGLCTDWGLGYGVELLCGGELRKQGVDVEQRFRLAIIESIRDRGRPVIAHGVIGPPEECIVAGYDEGGDVLIGWNFFQGFDDCNAGVEREPKGMFRKREWAKDTWSLLIIGEKQDPPERAHHPPGPGPRRRGRRAHRAGALPLIPRTAEGAP